MHKYIYVYIFITKHKNIDILLAQLTIEYTTWRVSFRKSTDAIQSSVLFCDCQNSVWLQNKTT